MKLRALNDESRIPAGGALDHVSGPRITTSRDNHMYKLEAPTRACTMQCREGHIPLHVDDVYGISVCVEKYVISKLSRLSNQCCHWI